MATVERGGSTPLHWAARYGHAPIVRQHSDLQSDGDGSNCGRLLLESKASPDEQNNMGDTAMHEAQSAN